MAKLRVRIASESGPRLCATIHDSARQATHRIIHTQRTKLKGVPAHIASVPVCPECKVKAEKQKVAPGVTLKFITL